MIFFIFLMIVCFITAIILSILAYRKKSITYITLAFIPLILFAVLFGIMRSELIKRDANVIAIKLMRILPYNFTKEDATLMNETMADLSKNQGSMFSWYNNIDLTPLNLEKYQ